MHNIFRFEKCYAGKSLIMENRGNKGKNSKSLKKYLLISVIISFILLVCVTVLFVILISGDKFRKKSKKNNAGEVTEVSTEKISGDAADVTGDSTEDVNGTGLNGKNSGNANGIVENSTEYSWSEDVGNGEELTVTTDEEGIKYSNDSSDFVVLSDEDPGVILEIRYYSTYNFVGDRIDGYEEATALITKEAAAALKEVSKDLEKKGYRLKIYDAYRPESAVENFVKWAEDPKDEKMKEYFYPDIDKGELFERGYIARHSGHSRGSTVDVTLFDMKKSKDVDMGGTFDYFGEVSQSFCEDITEEQAENRKILRDAMTAHGFEGINGEWWHFTLADEPYSDIYFNFPVKRDAIH